MDLSEYKQLQFDGTNYNNWKYRIGILLDEKGLTQYIEKDLHVILETEKDQAKRDQLITNEKKCKSILVRCIHDSQLEYVKDKTTAKDMYDVLQSVFERKSIAGQLLLRKQLLTLKFDENDNINNHFLVFDKIVRDLKAIGATTEEIDIVCHLLLTLPKSFDNLVTALETLDHSKLSLEFVKSRILDENSKKNDNGDNNELHESTAMYNKGKQLVCYGCGKPGHVKSKCFRNKNKNRKHKFNNNSSGSANSALNDDENLLYCSNNYDEQSFTANKSEVSLHTDDNAKITFILDSGATEHMVNKLDYFDSISEIDAVRIAVAKDGESLTANQHGDIKIKTTGGNFTIKDVLFVDKLKCNLLSIRKLIGKNYSVNFDGDIARISNGNNDTMFIGKLNGKLYEVHFSINKSSFAGITSGEKNFNLWHFRLGHLNLNDMKRMISNGMVNGLQLSGVADVEFCEPCVKGKHARLPYGKCKVSRSNRILELIHSDVCGPMSQPAWDGSRYFVTFTDDFSRATRVYCVERKSDVFAKFKEFVSFAEVQQATKICKLNVDNGGEYSSTEFKSFCKEKGIQIIYNVAYNPEMNSVAERMNRTLVEKARTMLLAANVDRKFWNEAVLTANYIKNRCPTNAIGDRFKAKTPAEIWYGNKPSLSNLKVFGSICFNHVPVEKRKKFDSKATKCLMLGYGSSSTYRLWCLETDKFLFGCNVTFNEKSVLDICKYTRITDSEAVNNDELIGNDDDGEEFCDAGDTSFNENDFIDFNDDDNEIHSIDNEDAGNVNSIVHSTKNEGTGNVISRIHSTNNNRAGNNNNLNNCMKNIHGVKGSTGNDNNLNDCMKNFHGVKDNISTGNNNKNVHSVDDGTGVVLLRRSKRERKSPEKFSSSSNIYTSDVHFALNAEIFVDEDPTTIAEAKQRDDWIYWKNAMKEEYSSLVKNKTWTLCDRPKDRKVISCKWVFKLKKKSDGSIDKYKARLVARGFAQEKGYDYNDTYSPTAKLKTLRVLLSVANHFNYPMHQMDVKSAFLNGNLNEEIYMQQPECFTNDQSKVCKLQKSIYGLKQASRMWNERFKTVMIFNGFKQCYADNCLYIKFELNIISYVLLYVDDLLIVSSNNSKINDIKIMLMNEFEMTSVEKVDTFLGIHIERDNKNCIIKLDQERYLKKVLSKFNMENCKTSKTPMEIKLDLLKIDNGDYVHLPYRQLIGCLTYATITTRPDLCAATSFMSRFQNCYTNQHFSIAKRILRYVKETIDVKLVFNRDLTSNAIIGYTDADWAGDKYDRKSTSGYVFKVFGNTVSWLSKKQATVSLSSTEAEYIALCDGACEAIWLRNLIAEMGIVCNEPIVIYEDNQSCIKVAEEPREHKRMKHIDVKYNFIREAITNKYICVKYIQSTDQLADIMTKALGKTLFEKHRNGLNLLN